MEPVNSPQTAAASQPVSAVSWGAIFAGALVAASVSLILLAVGSGLGFAAVSPWSGAGTSAAASTVMTAIWLIVMQWVASGTGGFITGRLRVRWIGTHAHEVFFRDTAHGFVTWALSTVIIAILAFAGAASLIGAGAHAVTAIASGAAHGAAQPNDSAPSMSAPAVAPYGLDVLFRPEHPGAADTNADSRAEASRIVLNSIKTGNLQDSDRAYLAQLVASRTGVSQVEAQKRVDDLVAQAKVADAKARELADAARKAAAEASLLAALSMLVGAFIACVAAALGGRHRDLHP